MARKKATMKAATASDEDAASPVGDTEDAPVVQPTRELRAGTIIHLPGSETPLTLATDVLVWGNRIDRDVKFVGMLMRHPGNWDLNIDQVEGTWSPVTGQRQPDEPEETEE